MNEREQAVVDLRRVADNQIVTDTVSENLQFIADLVESHDERVIDLLSYNNTMLEENRAQRREIERLKRRVEVLLQRLFGEADDVVPLSKEEHALLIKAVRTSHNLLEGLDAGDENYRGHEAYQLNIDALDLA